MTEETADEIATRKAAKIHQSAIVCKEVIIEGDVTIGAGTVIHPFAVIRATKGPIIIGDYNNIEELSLIENICDGQIMIIGDGNNIECCAIVHASSIGNTNNIQGKCEVGPGVIIGVKCQLRQKGLLPDRTVIYGSENSRRIAHSNPESILPMLDNFRKVLPVYHHIYKGKMGE